MRWYWYLATRNKDKFSLSPIFLDFTAERYITTGSRTCTNIDSIDTEDDGTVSTQDSSLEVLQHNLAANGIKVK
mgnify:CR=1 FL=1